MGILKYSLFSTAWGRLSAAFAALCSLLAGCGSSSGSAAGNEESLTCAVEPDGIIRDRWMRTGGSSGPLGCALRAEEPSPDGMGRVVAFRGGEITTSPGLGPNVTVAAYEQGPDVVVEWGDMPTAADHFVVQWSIDGGSSMERNVPNGFGTRGLWFLPPPRPSGVYAVTVGGCPTAAPCSPAQTVAAHVSFAAPPAGHSGSRPQCTPAFPTPGPIGARFAQLVGADGVLGCPIGLQVTVPGGDATTQSFANGQMLASPKVGPLMVLSLYQLGDALHLDWSSSAPRSYDKFLVRDAQSGHQFDYAPGGKIDHGTAVVVSQAKNGETYSFIIKGCHNQVLQPAQCDEWSDPVSLTFTARPSIEMATDGGVDFSGLVAVTSAAHVNDQIAERGRAADEYWACYRNVDGSANGNEQDWISAALARFDLLSRGESKCAISGAGDFKQELSDALARQTPGNVGSTISLAPCVRTGEYDVALTGYVRIVEQYADLFLDGPDGPLTTYIVNQLLTQKGPVDYSQFASCTFPFGVITFDETENHLNQIESARYLTNQILYAQSGSPDNDNEANGMNAFWLERLQRYLQSDFSEYNSKVYQSYTDNAIQNLYDFAKDRRVRVAARLVLDYITAKWAVSSNDLRRSAPYRRHVSDYSRVLLDDHMENQPGRFFLLSGQLQIMNDADFAAVVQEQPPVFHPNGWAGNVLDAAVSSYRPLPQMLDVMFEPANRSYYQRLLHTTLEIYASRPDYLISGGGFYVPPEQNLPFNGDNAGVAVPITLMPTGRFITTDNMLHFDGVGSIDDSRRVHTCVAPDFACGINLRIADVYVPPAAPANCVTTVDSTNGGKWTFIDFLDGECNPGAQGGAQADTGFYVAAWQGPGNTEFANFGFFEARQKAGAPAFSEFVQKVLDDNEGTMFTFGGSNTYVTTSGTRLVFSFPGDNGVGGSAYAWPFTTMGDPTLDALGGDVRRWPLASGDVMNSDGHSGLVTFDDRSRCERVVMDFRDFGEPTEAVVPMPAASSCVTRATPPDGGVSDGGVAVDVAPPSEAGASNGDASSCGAPDNTGPVVTVSNISGSGPPAMSGGPIVPGTYYLVAAQSLVNIDGFAVGPYQETAVFTDSTVSYVVATLSADGGAPSEERASMTFTLDGNAIALQPVCGPSATQSGSYTSTPAGDSASATIVLELGSAILTFQQVQP